MLNMNLIDIEFQFQKQGKSALLLFAPELFWKTQAGQQWYELYFRQCMRSTGAGSKKRIIPAR